MLPSLLRFKADLQKQARKKAEIRQKEAQKREAESLNRRHLAGLRVVQKNLVYVVGLNPRIREDDLLHTLRGSQYFGQYGKIIKIVVSRSKDVANKAQSLGVHVTFARQEDAEKCIAAVDGSENGGRVLRYGFTFRPFCLSPLIARSQGAIRDDQVLRSLSSQRDLCKQELHVPS